MRKTMTKTLSILLAGALIVLSTPIDSQAAKKPSLSKAKIDITQGSNKKLSVKNKKGYTVTWKSSKKTVVSVTKNGMVKAKRKGTAKVFAIVKNKKSGKSRKLFCQVVVKEKVFQGMTARANKVAPSAETQSVAPLPALIPDITSTPDVTPAPDVIPTSNATPTPEAIATSDPQDKEDPDAKKPEFVSANPVATESAKVLYSYAVGYHNSHVRTVLKNQIIDSYEQLQTLIRSAKDEVAGNPETSYEFTDIIRQMEAIDRDYFTSNVLCVGTIDDFAARGYDFEVMAATIQLTRQGDRVLDILLDGYWALPDGMCVTCDAVYYSCLVQMPRDAVQGCQSLVYGLNSAMR